MSDTIIGIVPDEWLTTTLGELCASSGGDIQTGPFGSQLHASDYVPSGIPSVMPQNIGDNVILEAGIARITPADANRLLRYLLKSGDIVYSRRGDVERRAWVRKEQDGWLCGTGCLRVRFGESVDSRFMSYYLGHPDVRAWIVQHAIGATMPNLNTTILGAVPVAIPLRPKQAAIARVLGALDDKIAVNNRIVAGIEQLAQAIFTAHFADALAFLTSDQELQVGWTASKLGETCSVLETGRRPKGGVAAYSTGVPSIGAESITRLAEFDFSKVKYVPEEYFADMKQGIVEDYDILLYKDGGRPGNFEPHVSMFGRGYPFDKMCINEHVYRIRLNEPLSQAFGYFWLTSEPLMAEMRSRGTGVAIPGLNSSAVRELPILCPPDDLRKRFDDSALPLIDLALNAASEARKLSQLRDTLLPKLMSGEIRVRDAEKVVEDVT